MGLLSTLYYDISLKSSRGLITPVRPPARYGYRPWLWRCPCDPEGPESCVCPSNVVPRNRSCVPFGWSSAGAAWCDAFHPTISRR